MNPKPLPPIRDVANRRIDMPLDWSEFPMGTKRTLITKNFATTIFVAGGCCLMFVASSVAQNQFSPQAAVRRLPGNQQNYNQLRSVISNDFGASGANVEPVEIQWDEDPRQALQVQYTQQRRAADQRAALLPPNFGQQNYGNANPRRRLISRNAGFGRLRQDDPFGDENAVEDPFSNDQAIDPFSDPSIQDPSIKGPVLPQPRQPDSREVQPRQLETIEPRQTADDPNIEYPPGSITPGDLPPRPTQPAQRQPTPRQPLSNGQPYIAPQPYPQPYSQPYVDPTINWETPAYPPNYSSNQAPGYHPNYSIPTEPYRQPLQPFRQPSTQSTNSFGDQFPSGAYQGVVGCDVLSAPAAGQDCGFDCGVPNFYFSVFAGKVSLDDLVPSNNSSSGNKIFTDDGPGFGVALGQRHGYNLRSELEYSYRSNDITGFQINNVLQSVTGDVTTYSGMANAYWEFMSFPRECFKPYVGAGIGFASINTDIMAASGQSLIPDADNNDTSLAYQFMAGVNYKAYRNMDLFLEYRLFAAESLRIDTLSGMGSGKYDYQTDNIFGGLRWKF